MVNLAKLSKKELASAGFLKRSIAQKFLKTKLIKNKKYTKDELINE